MPEPTGRGSREFLDSANQALSELEEATGKPVLIVEAPELKVLATIRRAGPEDSSHVLRIKGGENRAADYLIVFECRMALGDGQGPRAVLRSNPEVRGQVISECGVALLDAQVSVLLKSVDQRWGSDSDLSLENHARTA